MSIGFVPPRPDGAGPQGKWFQWAHDCLMNRLRQQDAPNQSSGRTTRGFYTVPGRLGGGSGSGEVQMLRLKSVQDDYLTCRSWDGTTEGGTDIFVAKAYKNRCSLTSESVYGVAHNYTYANGPDSMNRKRDDSAFGYGVETQRIIPPWCLNDVIFAIKVKKSGVQKDGTELTLLDIHLRPWARVRNDAFI